MSDAAFPHLAFSALGYESVHHGSGQWNGVAILSRVGPELLEEATKFRQDRTVDVETLEEAVEAGATGFARIRVGALGPDGEDRLATHALSIRCLQGADGGLAGADGAGEGDGDGDDLIAVVGRSY